MADVAGMIREAAEAVRKAIAPRRPEVALVLGSAPCRSSG